MTSKPSEVERYLETLEGALEALGPDETREVVAEVRSLLADATADAHGDEGAAVEGFGSPTAFAAGVLEERGVLCGESRVSEASSASQTAALAIDVAFSLVAVAFLYGFMTMSLGTVAYWGYSGPFVTALAWVVVAAFLGALAWWWVKRRRPGYTSTGMEAAGIRRIRVGENTRVVRSRDIPAPGASNRLMPKVKVALALLILVSFVYSVAYASKSQWQARIDRALWDASVGAYVVTDVYRQVVMGVGASSLRGSYEPSASDGMTALEQRFAGGKTKSYAVAFVKLPEGATSQSGGSDLASEITVLVGIREFGGEYDVPVVYQYRVRCLLESPEGESVNSGQWLIESIVPVDG
ncbi:MAG: hypothetical protein Q8M66_01640 [Actinomycetota bacterium]|nr:hypothetical protein [Actinomycetota bacterium]MDZ4179064.1 hypothetical protein [Coriobacteriia bacterium]